MGAGALAAEQEGEGSLYSVSLGIFEGPVDLLLRLVEAGELDLLHLPLAAMAEQILESLRASQEVAASLDLGTAGRTVATAASLLRQKVKALLPPDPESEEDEEEAGEEPLEEGEDPEEELLQRLAEYRLFKRVAAELEALRAVRAHCFPRAAAGAFAPGEGAPVAAAAEGAAQEGEVLPVDGPTLAQAFRSLLARRQPALPRESLPRRSVSLSFGMERIMSRLREAGGRIAFPSLFAADEDRSVWIVVFLALLELLRRGRVDIYQQEPFGPIWVRGASGGSPRSP